MKNSFDKITETIIGGAIAVHRALGPGLLESAYEACLSYELVDRGLSVERQKALPVKYRGVNLWLSNRSFGRGNNNYRA